MKMQTVKRRKRISPSNLFLLELILAILIFTVASAICVTLFAKSHILHRQAYQQGKCVEIVRNAAELLRSNGTGYIIKDKFNYFYDNKAIEDPTSGVLTLYLDSQCYGTDKEDGEFILTVSPLFGLSGFKVTALPVSPVGDYKGVELSVLTGGY